MITRPFPLEKYRFYFHDNRVIAVSTYAKQTVRGTAICDASDSYDVETGKKLAAARCNEKIAAKRLKRASEKFRQAENELRAAQDRMNKMREYLNDSVIGYNEAAIETDTLVKNLKGIN